MAHTRAFPRADSVLALDLWHLGRAAVSRYAQLSREEVYQSMQAAFTAHVTGVTLDALLRAPSVRLCGPKRSRKRTVIKKR